MRRALRPHAANVVAHTASPETDRNAAEVHALTDCGPLAGLRSRRDLVVVITRWGGHSQHALDPERVVLELWGKGMGK